MALYTDVTKEEEVEKLVHDVVGGLGSVDIVRVSYLHKDMLYSDKALDGS